MPNNGDPAIHVWDTVNLEPARAFINQPPQQQRPIVSFIESSFDLTESVVYRTSCGECGADRERRTIWNAFIRAEISCPSCGNAGADVTRAYIRYGTPSQLDILDTALATLRCFRCGIQHSECCGVNLHPTNGIYNRYCGECLRIVRASELIHGHNWSPGRFRLQVGKSEVRKQDTIFYGTELEINTPENQTNHARLFKEWLDSKGMGDYFYFKRDGSLSTGYEIVTHPLTCKARHEKIDWKAICEYLRKTGASSEESGECGLHIHASRDGITEREIGKLKYFFFNNRLAIHKFSRRQNYRYTQIEAFTVRNSWRGSSVARALQIYPDSMDRYVAVNVHTGKPTVEFRIMRGTLDHERLIASFQFIDALIHFVKGHSIMSQETPYSWITFCKWAAEFNKYNHMVRYFRKEGLTR